jgi:hypothetical protein
MPEWLYLTLARLSGELWGYIRSAISDKHSQINLATDDPAEWFREVKSYLEGWVEAHGEGADDTWTPKAGELIHHN